MSRGGEREFPAPAVAKIADPEARAGSRRRHFTAAYKFSLLEEADWPSNFGALGARLRRGGLSRFLGRRYKLRHRER